MSDRAWVGLGDRQEVTPTRQESALEAHEAAYQYAVRSHTHLWVAAVSYRLSDTSLDAFEGTSTDTPLLDVENLSGPPAIGCYVCEQPYERRLRLRRCPGEPS